MRKEFRVIRDYYDTGELLYTRSKLYLDSGITVLVGCNGAGKSTLIHQLKDQLAHDKIFTKSFDNLMDGGYNARESAGYRGDLTFLATSMSSSEGENILMNVGRFSSGIAGLVQRIRTNSLKDYEKSFKRDCIFIFLDATDSGMSINTVVEIKNFLKELVIPDCESVGLSPFVIIAANAYEFPNGEDCLDVQHMKHITFKDYEEYKQFVIKSAEYKENRDKKRSED